MKLLRKRMYLALLLALPATAPAFLGASVTASVRDAASGKPLDGAFVVVREFADVGQFHGSSTYCVRAGAAAIESPSARVDIPGPGSDVLTRARAFEGLAFRPGYCMARIGNAPSAARHKRVSMGMAPPPELDPSEPARFEMRRSGQSPEERLIYLERVAAGLICHESRWGRGSAEALGRIADALAAEARSISTSRYEKALAAGVTARLDAARRMPRGGSPSAMAGAVHPAQSSFARDFIVVPGDSRVLWSRENPAVVGIASGMAASAARNAATGAVHASPTSPPQPQGLTIRCRHGAPSACDLDERNAQGETALWGYVRAGKVDEVKALLQAGADPNVPQRPGGRTAIEMALGQVLLDYDSAARAAEIVDALAADPRTTLHGPLKEDLASDPSTWNQHQPRVRERLLQRREALARLPARKALEPGCEDPGFEFAFEEPPPRLRPVTLGAR